MTFEEMCAACQNYTCFAINNIPKDNYKELRSMISETNPNCELPSNLNRKCCKNLSVRFNNGGNFAGWIEDDSYSAITDTYIRNHVMGGNYDFSDLDIYPQATLDIMSVL